MTCDLMNYWIWKNLHHCHECLGPLRVSPASPFTCYKRAAPGFACPQHTHGRVLQQTARSAHDSAAIAHASHNGDGFCGWLALARAGSHMQTIRNECVCAIARLWGTDIGKMFRSVRACGRPIERMQDMTSELFTVAPLCTAKRTGRSIPNGMRARRPQRG